MLPCGPGSVKRALCHLIAPCGVRRYTLAVVLPSSRRNCLRAPSVAPARAAGKRSFFLFASFLLLAAALGAGCSDREEAAPIGLGTLEPGRFEVDVRALFVSPRTDTYAEIVSSTGESRTLYVGDFDERQMRSLVRFGSLSSGIVRDARVIFKVMGSAGDDGPITIAAHRVLADWLEATADITRLPAFDSTAAATVVSAPGDTTLSFPLPVELVQAWIDSSGGNHGLYLTPSEPTTTLRKLASVEAETGKPFLRIVRSSGGSDVTDSVLADKDTYVAHPDTTEDRAVAEALLVGRRNGFTLRSAFEFVLPESLETTATLNFAQLELRLDRDAAGLEDSTFIVTAHEVVSSVDTSAVVFRLDSEALATMTSSTDSLAFNLTLLAGRLRLSRLTRLKVLLKSPIEAADTDHIAIVSSEGAEADSLRPRLRLIVSSSSNVDTMLVAPSAASAN